MLTALAARATPTCVVRATIVPDQSPFSLTAVSIRPFRGWTVPQNNTGPIRAQGHVYLDLGPPAYSSSNLGSPEPNVHTCLHAAALRDRDGSNGAHLQAAAGPLEVDGAALRLVVLRAASGAGPAASAGSVRLIPSPINMQFFMSPVSRGPINSLLGSRHSCQCTVHLPCVCASAQCAVHTT